MDKITVFYKKNEMKLLTNIIQYCFGMTKKTLTASM